MRRRRVLVVDDEEDVINVLRLVLSKSGYDVITASSGMDGLMRAQSESPEAILLDIMMHEMDGWEVLKLLRVDEETRRIPVAMLSARTEAKDRVQGLQEGAVDYICKPFSLQELLGKIEVIFSQLGERGQATR